MRKAIRSLFNSTGDTNGTASNPTSDGRPFSEGLSKAVAKKTKKEINSPPSLGHTNPPLETSSDAVSAGNSNNSGRNEGLNTYNQTEEEGPTNTRDSRVVEVNDTPETKPFTIDPEVLEQLFAWREENPDNRLTTVLLKVSKAMESEVFKTALKLIPSGGPVPVGAIVECVAAIVLVGIKTRERKNEALDFALRVVGDIDALANALGASNPNEDPLWDQCKGDLQPFCDAANEVCQWALKQLRSRLALSADELVTLDKKMENANTLFMRLSTVRMLRALSNQFRDISRTLQFIERRTQLDRIRTGLSPQIAKMYLYSEQGKQDCHPGTRDEILGMVDKWLWIEHSTATGDYLKRCWWITGTAGVGKSAIAISAIHCLLDRKRLAPHPGPDTGRTQPPILVAQYFFNHKLGNSVELSRLFPTLALQLAQVSPVIACMLQKTLTDGPSIVNRFGLEQAEKLFLAPLCELCNLNPEKSVVIVIDGLDELSPLSGEGKEHCYGLITKVLISLAERLPPNAGLVILSRPETEFLDNIPDHVHRHHLDTKAFESRRAVRTYFMDELPTICRDPGFPSGRQLDALCAAADGHLGWAKGARSWLWSFFKTSPDPNLRDQAIVDLTGLAPGDLPALYCHMLAGLLQRIDESQQSKYGENLRSVLSILVVLREPQQIGTICKLVQFDARTYLHDLSGVYADGTKSITNETVPQPHKSFYDFVVSDKMKRDLPTLHVDIPTAHHQLASRCFQIMQSDLYFNMGRLQSPKKLSDEVRRHARTQIPAYVRYACTSFMQHVQGCQRTVGEEATQWFGSMKFLFWLEVLVISSAKPWFEEWILVYQVFRLLREHLHPEIQTLIQHSIDFVIMFGVSFAENPFLIYLTALPFSPSSFQSSCLTQHITIKSRQDGWVRKGRYIPCTISPDGESLAILSKDQLSLFSVGSGRPLWERATSVSMQDSSCLTFSEDGKTLFVGGKVGLSAVNILLVDAVSGDLEKELVLETSYDIQVKDKIRVSLSPGRAYITLWTTSSGHNRLYLYPTTGGPPLWNWPIRGCAIRWLSEGYFLVPLGLNRMLVVNAQMQTSILLDSTEKHAYIGLLYHKSDKDGDVLAVGLHGDVVVIGLHGHIVVWKGLKQLTSGTTMTGTILKPEYFRVGGHFVTTCCFSPDGKHLALGPGNRTIELWSCTTWTLMVTLYGLVDRVIDELTFRRNGKQLVSRSRDGTIQIWDISAIVEGREHGVEAEEGALAAGSWFKHGIQLGGFFLRGEQPEPFVFDYPFELPEGVERLNWEIKDSNKDEASVLTD